MKHFSCEHMSDTFAADQSCPYTLALDEPASLDIPDCFGRFPESPDRRWSGRPNPMIGPIQFEGAEVGDTLAVEMLDLEPVGDAFYGRDDERTWLPIDRERRRIQFPGGHEVALSPHIGTIGVAPADGQCNTTDAGDHGGNLDCTLIRKGTVVYFRVNQPGAGLGLADVHAAMGDGETGGQGAEVAARGAIRVTTVPGLPLSRPYGVYDDTFFVIGWGYMLDAAADMAQQDMVAALQSVTDLSETQAWKFLGSAADLRVCWRGARTPVMRMELPLAHLSESSRAALRECLGLA